MEIEKKPDRAGAIGADQIRAFNKILEEYKAGKANTEQRILASENWWKLRNSIEEQKESKDSGGCGFKSTSGWLHNVIVSKHADAMECYPEPNILPREESDKGEARMLTAIIPCVLEQNKFERTYNDAMWQKLKTGTGAYKVVWDASKLGGLGDIGIERVNLLNVYFEPGVTDIQKSRYFFHTELYDKDILEEMYPELKGKLKGQGFLSTKFLYDDHVKTEDKHTVVDVYYHKTVGGKQTLQYCKYVGDVVIYATENDTERPTREEIDPATGEVYTVEAGPSAAERGLYDHARYPYHFDPLFPIEGSPLGYGFVDLCRNPQTAIDLLNTSFIENARVGSKPRYFSRMDGDINEEEFLDLTKPLVHVPGNVDETSLRRIEHVSLDGMYVNVYDRLIAELRETSGNTETSTGNVSSGVTAASAIAALQEASGKGSRDMTQATYDVYSGIVEMCIELIRQFYDMPRKFRILGQYGAEQYVTYTNAGLKPQPQGNAFGNDMGERLPVFDIKVSAQKKNVYTKVTQNELAIQFFQMGFFNPQHTDQALMCLEMMDFDGKDSVIQKVAQNGTIFKKLVQYMQIALGLAQSADPMLAQQIANELMMLTGGAAPGGMPTSSLTQSDNIAGIKPREHGVVTRAREKANAASQPGGARAISERRGK